MITGMFWSSGSVLVSKCYMFGTYDLGKYIFSDMYFCHLCTLAFLTTKDLAREVYQAKLHSSVSRISDNLQLPCLQLLVAVFFHPGFFVLCQCHCCTFPP